MQFLKKLDSRVTASLSGNTLLFEGVPWSMTAQIVRTVQKATCGDLKNFKRSGAVCEPLPVKRTAKKCKVSPASSISCWPLFSVPGMGSISARCTGRGLICGEGEGFVFGCVPPEEDDRAAWAILLRKNGFSLGFVKFLPKFKKVLASYTGVRCTILSRKKRGEMACWPEPLR